MVTPMDMPKRKNCNDDLRTNKEPNNLAYSTNSIGEVINNFRDEDSIATNEQIEFWFKCYRKQRYRSKHVADSVANYYKVNSVGENHTMLSAYKCDYCSYYHVGKNNTTEERDNHRIMHGMRKMWRTQENRPGYGELLEAFTNPRNAPNAPYAKNNEKFKQIPELWNIIVEGEI